MADDDLFWDVAGPLLGSGLVEEQNHPRAGLLKHKMLQVRWIVDVPDSVTTPGFVDWCGSQLLRAADVHHWLVRNFT